MTKQRTRRRAAPPPRQGPRSSTLILGIAGLVIAGAAIAAFALTQGGSSAGASASSGSTPIPTTAEVTGAPLPAYAPGVDDPAVGQPAPQVEGASFDGTPVGIAADGRPKLLLFLAHWCPHCQREVPVVQSWIDANGMPEGVDLISVATAIDPNQPNYPPEAWLARERWQPPVIVDGDGRIATDYGLTAFPYWIAIGADGTVVSRLTGELTPEQLDTVVAALQ